MFVKLFLYSVSSFEMAWSYISIAFCDTVVELSLCTGCSDFISIFSACSAGVSFGIAVVVVSDLAGVPIQSLVL